MEQVSVYNNQYEGPSYSVKYLGIVDGTMGILSRKMAMPAQAPNNPTHYKEVIANLDIKKYSITLRQWKFRLQPKLDLCAPVLGGKSYALKLGTQIPLVTSGQRPRVSAQGPGILMDDQHAIVYSKKNSINMNSNHPPHQQQLDHDPNGSSLTNQFAPSLSQYNPHGESGVEVVNVKIKDLGGIMQDYSMNTQFAELPQNQLPMNIIDARQSLDKTSNNDSPSRLYMRSLMDHSVGQGPSLTKSQKSKGKQKSSSMLKSNLKLTGKNIIEGSNLSNLQYAVRAASKEGSHQPRDTQYQLDYNTKPNESQMQPKSQNSTMYSNKPSVMLPEQDYYSSLQQKIDNERVSGYPKPELYNQHYINKYSFPKGLQCMKKSEEQKKKNQRVSLYDLETPQVRKGISGWKLTKRPIMMQLDQSFQQSNTIPLQPQVVDTSKKLKRKRGGTKGYHAGNHTFIQEPNEGGQGIIEEYNPNIHRSVNQDHNNLTNIKISYHNGSSKANEQFSGEAQPYGGAAADNNSYRISPREAGNTGGGEEQETYSNRKLNNQYM